MYNVFPFFIALCKVYPLISTGLQFARLHLLLLLLVQPVGPGGRGLHVHCEHVGRGLPGGGSRPVRPRLRRAGHELLRRRPGHVALRDAVQRVGGGRPELQRVFEHVDGVRLLHLLRSGTALSLRLPASPK